MNPANIFNSAKRGVKETANYTCYSTFSFNDSQNEFREPFGQLKFLNDESLSPLESITYTHEEDVQVLVLPITGALNYCPAPPEEILVRSEQVKIIEVKKGSPYTFTNPFEKEWINYLHIGFKVNASHQKPQSTLQNIQFRKLDELVPFGFNGTAKDQPFGSIGIYQGRSEGSYALKNPNNGIFIYIIEGAFEVQGRLLEHRDGLSLWDTEEIEFEALSTNAIIMLLEIKLK